jgi:hypothetical protein
LLPQFGAKITDALQGAKESEATRAARQAMLDGRLEQTDDFRETAFSVGTLGAVNFVVRGLRELREVPLIAGQPDLKRLVCGGEARLTNLPPGEYLLHVIVKDPLANAKFAEADQWIDFTVQE